MATKVFPSSIFTSSNSDKQLYQSDSSSSSSSPINLLESGKGQIEVLTVWKKSLLIHCSGFTVYNGNGNLVYRVDNYTPGIKGEIVLMDATGKALLTIRRKGLSVGDCWLIYDGDTAGKNPPKLCVRKNVSLFNSKNLAQVTTSSSSSDVVYKIKGSYDKRSVSIYNSARECVAEIRRKEAPGGISLGVDVFNLITSESSLDSTTAMGFVILLEEMFGSSSS